MIFGINRTKFLTFLECIFFKKKTTFLKENKCWFLEKAARNVYHFEVFLFNIKRKCWPKCPRKFTWFDRMNKFAKKKELWRFQIVVNREREREREKDQTRKESVCTERLWDCGVLWVWPSHQQWCHVKEDLWVILA